VCFPSADIRKNILEADHYMHFNYGQILRIVRCINADSDRETVNVLINLYHHICFSLGPAFVAYLESSW
jgi:hypothetical protein